ncbi:MULTISPECIES: hypothetical protein [Pirellulaceae]|nr:MULTISPECIES: hypothetical protein [Pirellulaceae]
MIIRRNPKILREMPSVKTINGELAQADLDAVEADPWPVKAVTQ